MLKNIAPDESWEEFDIEIDCYCTTLEKARKKAEIHDYTSTGESVLGKGKRKRISKNYSSDDDESDCSIVPPPLLVKRKICEKNQSIILEEDNTSNASPNITDLPIIFTDHDNIARTDSNIPTPTILSFSSTEIQSSVLDSVTLLNHILQTVTEIKLEVCSLKRALHRAEQNMVNEFEDINFFLPIADITSLEAFEMYLSEDNEKHLKLKEFIATIGGRGSKDHITISLARMYSNGMSVSCSWLGLRNNYRVCNLKSITVLKYYIISEYHMTEKEFEAIAAEWFRHSRQRLSRLDKTLN